jgi:hypothetical protein
MKMAVLKIKFDDDPETLARTLEEFGALVRVMAEDNKGELPECNTYDSSNGSTVKLSEIVDTK